MDRFQQSGEARLAADSDMSYERQSLTDGESDGFSQRDRKPPLLIHTRTWERESHGLYDYETSVVQKQQFDLAQDSVVYRVENQVVCASFQEDIEARFVQARPLLKITGNFEGPKELEFQQ